MDEDVSSALQECNDLCESSQLELAVVKCKLALDRIRGAMHDLRNPSDNQSVHKDALSMLTDIQVSVLVNLSKAQEQSGSPRLSLEALQQASEIADVKDPRKISINSSLADLLCRFGYFDAAKSVSTKELQKKVENTEKKFQSLKKRIEKEITTLKQNDNKNGAKNNEMKKLEEEIRILVSDQKNGIPYFGEAYDLWISALLSLKDLNRAVDAARAKGRVADAAENALLLAKIYLEIGNLKISRKYVDECLRQDPDNKKCSALRTRLKSFEDDIKAASSLLLAQAIEKLLLLLEETEKVPEDSIYYDPRFSSILGVFRLPVVQALCTKQARRKLVVDAEKYCKEARQLDSSNPNSGIDYARIMSEMYISKEMHEEALSVLTEKSLGTAPRTDKTLSKLIQQAEKGKAEMARIKYYKALEVDKSASDEDIKNSYNKLVRKWHPDKQKDEESKKAALERMHLINAAYEVLRDKKKRAQYDAGFDPNDPNAGASQAHTHSNFGGFNGGHGHPFGGSGGSFSFGGNSFKMEDFSQFFNQNHAQGNYKKKSSKYSSKGGSSRDSGKKPFWFDHDDL